MLNARKNLGLAVTEQAITAVEIAGSDQRTILHSAVLPLGGDEGLSQPEQLGRQLKQALRSAGIHASHCVIGLAASWIVSREKILPAADPESLRGIMSLSSERDFASGSQELAFDYCTSPHPPGISALMAGAPRKIVDQVVAMAQAAGLSVQAVTPSIAALAMATKQEIPAESLMLCLLSGGAEVAGLSGQGLSLIRHVPVPLDGAAASADSLAGPVRRILALAGSAQQDGQRRQLLVWDLAGVGSAMADELGRRLGLPARHCTLQTDLAVSGGASAPIAPLAQAAALACVAGQTGGLDLLHSKLIPPKPRRIGRKMVWAGIGAAAALAAGVYLFQDWQSTQSQIAGLSQKKAALQEPARQAQSTIDSVSFARTWYDRRPEFLDAWKELTGGFPDEGRIWATSLMMKEEAPAPGRPGEAPAADAGKKFLQVTLSGKSANEAAALELLDRLKVNPRLKDVKPLFIRQAGGTSRDVSFAISMSYREAR